MALAPAAMAQTALPEQRLSTTISTRYHDPQLTAAGARVFGAWGGADALPNNISYGFSLDRGMTWINEAALPLIFSAYGVGLPFALFTNSQGTVDLMVLTSTHFYYRRPSVGVAAWNAPVYAVVADGDYDDVQSIRSDPASNAVYFAYTHKLDNYDYRIRFIRSLDNGATWSTHVVLSSPNCNGSSMVVGPDGTLYVTWVDYALGQVLLRRSTDHGATFAAPIVVASMFDNLAAAPAGWNFPFDTGVRDYPYYQSGVARGAPNFPALAVDRSNGAARGTLYLTWADHAEGASAPATTTVSDSEPNDSDFTAQLVPLDCDISGFAYQDHAGNYDADFFAFDGVAGETVSLDGDNYGYFPHELSLVEQLPNGARPCLGIVSMPGSYALSNGSHEKPMLVTLPRSGRYVFAVSGGGEGWSYTLRLRRFNVSATSLARDMRDIVLIRSSDGGATWSPKVRVNHDPGGADQHQPNVAVDEQGRVYVAWYDRRGSEYGDEVRPFAAVSVDGGATFGLELPLRNGFNPWDGSQSAELIGDRIALAAGDDFAMVSWTDFRDWPNRCDIYASRIVDIPTAVAAVSDLAAEPAGNVVRLHWRVNDARALSAIEVLRASEGELEHVVGAATMTGAEGGSEYVDATVEPGRAYAYRLRVAAEGASYHLGPVAVQTPARIHALAWRAAGPNPFAQRTSVTLAVPSAAEGAVRIYDVQGKVVRTLREGALEPGELRLDWDGRDAAGVETAPGLYFVAAQVGDATVRTKLTRVR